MGCTYRRAPAKSLARGTAPHLKAGAACGTGALLRRMNSHRSTPSECAAKEFDGASRRLRVHRERIGPPDDCEHIWERPSLMRARRRDSMIASALVIDDSPVQRDHALQLCSEVGIATVYSAGNGRQALELLAGLSRQPELLVVDLEMPTM